MIGSDPLSAEFSSIITFLTGLYFRFLEENKIALSNLQKEAKLLKERELAGGVQKSLFPNIEKFENFIYAKNVPARDVSGDYFDVVKVSSNEYFFTLADVSGKGIKAGMYMACLLYTSPSPRDRQKSRMPSSA